MTRPSEEETLLALIAAARADDPSIEAEAALPVARHCLRLLRADPHLSTAELARRCVAELPNADVSWVNHISRAVVAYTRGRDRRGAE